MNIHIKAFPVTSPYLQNHQIELHQIEGVGLL